MVWIIRCWRSIDGRKRVRRVIDMDLVVLLLASCHCLRSNHSLSASSTAYLSSWDTPGSDSHWNTALSAWSPCLSGQRRRQHRDDLVGSSLLIQEQHWLAPCSLWIFVDRLLRRRVAHSAWWSSPCKEASCLLPQLLHHHGPWYFHVDDLPRDKIQRPNTPSQSESRATRSNCISYTETNDMNTQ